MVTKKDASLYRDSFGYPLEVAVSFVSDLASNYWQIWLFPGVKKNKYRFGDSFRHLLPAYKIHATCI
jgi:hypothetical protein